MMYFLLHRFLYLVSLLPMRVLFLLSDGPEKGACSGHLPVVFAAIEKPRRGHYHATIKLACADAAWLPEGELTFEYVRYPESVIRRQPDMWLWSHRRWKHAWKDGYQSMRIFGH